MRPVMRKNKQNESVFVDPLFPDITSPKMEQVGFLMALTCGHNRHPKINEKVIIQQHLELAGFQEPIS